jgi:hypothetical protein
MIAAMRTISRLAVAIVLLAVCASAALASGGRNRVVGDCNKSQIKPSEIILACADGNAGVEHIHWTSFGGATARGSGSYFYNTCTPSCVAGKVKSDPVTLSASQAKPCFDSQDDYRALSLVFAAGAPYKTKQFTLYCPTG